MVVNDYGRSLPQDDAALAARSATDSFGYKAEVWLVPK